MTRTAAAGGSAPPIAATSSPATPSGSRPRRHRHERKRAGPPSDLRPHVSARSGRRGSSRRCRAPNSHARRPQRPRRRSRRRQRPQLRALPPRRHRSPRGGTRALPARTSQAGFRPSTSSAAPAGADWATRPGRGGGHPPDAPPRSRDPTGAGAHRGRAPRPHRQPRPSRRPRTLVRTAGKSARTTYGMVAHDGLPPHRMPPLRLQPWLRYRMVGCVAESDWVLLAYRMPREPSAPRVTVWRKLRRLGAVQVVDGLVALPATAETVEAFGWLADEVVEAGGDAWTWRATGSKDQDKALRQQLKDAVTEEYAALTAEAKRAMDGPERLTVERLRRTLRDIERRDFAAPRARDDARRAVQRVADAMHSAVTERER